MNNWSIVILFLNTWVFIHALYVDEKCYSSNPCFHHRLNCAGNGENLNRKIAIMDAKFGFKTSTCNIQGCDLYCCREEEGDCFEPFSKDLPVQRSLYAKCEFKKECNLDKSHRTRGCRSGLSTYSRIEYECLEDSNILTTTGYKQNQTVSVLFKGSDPGFPNTGISCSIRSNGLLRITNYYTRLTYDRSEDAQARSKPNFFNESDCTTENKMSVQIKGGPILLCHEEGEFFYTQPRDISETAIDMNLVITRLEYADIMWLGFFAPQGGGRVVVNCRNLDVLVAPRIGSKVTTSTTDAIGSKVMTTTTDTTLRIVDTMKTDTAVYIGVGVVVGILVICIPIVILVIFMRRRSKSNKGPIRKYSEVAVDDELDETGHYAAVGEDPSGNRSHETGHQITASKVKNSSDGYTYVDRDYLRKPNSATTSSGVKFPSTNQPDSSALQKISHDRSKVSVVEVHTPDSPKYSHIDYQKPGNSISNKNQAPVYSEVNKPKTNSKPKNEEYTEPDLKDKGDNSNLQTDNYALEDEYNHLSALTSKSRNLVKSPLIVEDTYSHI